MRRPLLGVREAGSVLRARVRTHHADGLTELAVAGGAVFLPSVQAGPGAQLRLRINAQDVILSRNRPTGLSALNILEGTVTALRHGEGPGVMVRLRLGEEDLLARVTRRSAETLGLGEGVHCFAIAKSVAVARGDVGHLQTGSDPD